MKTKKRNPFVVIGLALLSLLILCALFVVGLHFYNQSCLKKEAALIQQKGLLVEIDGKNMNMSNSFEK